MKRTFYTLSIALLVGVLFFSGCANPFDSKPDSGDAQGNLGRVAIQVGSPARTLQPELTGFTRYEAAFSTAITGASHDTETITGTTAEVDLVPGAWTITVTAFTGTGDTEKTAAQGSATVTVTANQTVPAAITLTPYTGEGAEKGTFGYSVSYPAGLKAGELVITKTDGTAVGDPIDLMDSTNTKTGTLSLAAGQYKMQIRLTANDGMIAGRTEALHIYPTLTSQADYPFNAADFVPFAEMGSVELTGTAKYLDDAGTAFDKAVTISLYNVSFKKDYAQDDPLNDWSTNLPAGLVLKAKNFVEIGGTTITLNITGTPTEEKSGVLAITIPEAALSSGKPLEVRANPDAKFDIGLPAASAAATVTGTLSGETDKNLTWSVSITLTNNTFKSITVYQQVKTWFTGLPATLDATVAAAVAEGDKTLTVNITGKPTAVVESGALTISIPAESLSRGEALAVTESLDFAITLNTMSGVYIVGVVGPATSYTGHYWKYSKDGAETINKTITGAYNALAIVGEDVYLAGYGNGESPMFQKNGEPQQGISATSTIGPHMAVDETGGVYIVSQRSLWKMTDDGKFPDEKKDFTYPNNSPSANTIAIMGMAVDEKYLYLIGSARDFDNTGSSTRYATYWKYDKTDITLVDGKPVRLEKSNASTVSKIVVTEDTLYILGSVTENSIRRPTYWTVLKNSDSSITEHPITTDYDSNFNAITVSEDGTVYLAGSWRTPSPLIDGDPNPNTYGQTAAYWKVIPGGLEKHNLGAEPTRYSDAGVILNTGTSIAVDGTDVYVAGWMTTHGEYMRLTDPIPVYWKHAGGTGAAEMVKLAATGAADSEARVIIVK